MANEKRLIDGKKLFNDLADYWGIPRDWDGRMLQTCEDALSMIENAPTVDAVPVVHGEWEKYTDDRFMGYGADGRIRYRKVYSYKCSKCWNYTAIKHNYCPHCGAKMDGGNKDGC